MTTDTFHWEDMRLFEVYYSIPCGPVNARQSPVYVYAIDDNHASQKVDSYLQGRNISANSIKAVEKRILNI